jgi:hypothetical protein
MKTQELDPVISEIRETRHRISARFGHDPRRLVAHYLQRQECHRDRLIGDRAPHEEETSLTSAASASETGQTP